MKVVKWLGELSRHGQVHIISKTVENYPLEWIVIHEVLQNAIDAVKKVKKEDKKIEITLDSQKNAVTVFDNGVGFPFDLRLLGFGGTNKTEEDLGEIGVGIKVIIASSKEFSIQAVFTDKDGKNKKWKCKIENGYKILQRDLEDIDIFYEEPTPTNEETYTQVQYSFPDSDQKVREFIQKIYKEYIESGRISALLADTLSEKFKVSLLHYFRTQGYAANVFNLINNKKDVDIHLRILPDPFISINELVEITFPNKYWDIEEIIEKTRRGYRKPRKITIEFPEDGGYIGSYTENDIYIQKFSNWDSIKRLLTNSQMRRPPDLNEFRRIVDRYINGIYLIIASRDLLRDYLCNFPSSHFITAYGIPSVHQIQAPTGVGFLGYLNNLVFIVDLKQRLTYGKQTIKSPRVIGFINELFREAFRATLIRACSCIVGIRERLEEGPSPLVEPAIEIVSRENIEPPILAIKKVPKEEIEVIAIFSELIGRGVLKEYEIWALSTRAMYDGKILIRSDKSIPPRSDRDLNTLEFKINISSLVDDLTEGRKYLDEINLIVVWRDDFQEAFERGHPYYEVIPIIDTELENLKLSFIEKCLHDKRTGRKVPVLELSEVIKKAHRSNF
jgi:hypothetical protein